MFFKQLLTLICVKLTTGWEPTSFLFNYNKTNFMLLSSQKHNPTSFKVIINNYSISPEDKLKYLGVLLDNKLSWKPHVQKVKTQLPRAYGVLTKLKRYTTQSALKVVYNSLIHPYLNYSILNWRRASNATIQPLIKLQNKAIKIIKPTNTKSVGDPFQHLNILSLPKIYTLSVGKFIHSYHNKLLLNHFDEYFIPMNSIHSYSTRLVTSKKLFLPELTLPQENVPSPLLALKCGLHYQMMLSLQPRLPLNGNWRNTSNMIKIHNCELLQYFTYPEPISVNSVYIYFSHFFFPVHIPFFSAWKHTP